MRLGSKMTPEQRSNLSRVHKGVRLSKAHRSAIARARTGVAHNESTKKKISNSNKGKIFTEERREKIGKAHSGSKSHWWKGGTAYSSIHLWVRRTLGTPDTCESCGASGLYGRAINWSNKNHEYRKVKSEWQRLCRKCHWKYDYKEAKLI